ncbi:hypothetical protein C8R44DRAFT_750319 [Mycena epipterygia]|nr:hypothetical protein C8R44DRAFT_750319 [Mycena epipterygia]
MYSGKVLVLKNEDVQSFPSSHAQIEGCGELVMDMAINQYRPKIFIQFTESWRGATTSRRFQRGSGFGPDTQHLVQHLGYPLLQVQSDLGTPFAHFVENDDSSEDADSDRDDNTIEQHNTSREYETPALDNPSPSHDSPLGSTEGSIEILGKRKTLQAMMTAKEMESLGLWGFDDLEVAPPSRSWNMIMYIQLALMLTLGVSWMYDHLLTNEHLAY